jgi:hypothetical protein
MVDDRIVMWQRSGMLTEASVADVVESSLDKCHQVGECNGATWPSHGLPRGTPY